MVGASAGAAPSGPALSVISCPADPLPADDFNTSLDADCVPFLPGLYEGLEPDTDGFGDAGAGWSADGWRVAADRVRWGSEAGVGVGVGPGLGVGAVGRRAVAAMFTMLCTVPGAMPLLKAAMIAFMAVCTNHGRPDSMQQCSDDI